MSNYSVSKFNPKDDNTSWQKTFRLVPEKSLVLDIGCSSGTFGARLIKEKGCIVDGIEIDPGDIRAAKKVLRNVYDIDIERDNIDVPEKYDVVFMGDVIEHLARPIKALEKIKKILKPQGQLIFSMPNVTHMSVRLMLLRGQIAYGRTGLLDETHLHFYNSEEIARVFNNAGYQITTFDYTINDTPEEVLSAELKEIGLTANASFLEIAQSVDAVAYQFIGVAKVGTSKASKLPNSSPPNIVDKYYKKLKENYEKHTAGIIADRDRVLADRDRIEAEYKQLRNRKDIRLILKASKKLKRNE